MHVGMRIPPMGREMGLEGIIQWASENDLGSIDLPEVDAEIRKLCDSAGIGIGTVDWGAGGGLLSKDDGARGEAMAAMKARIQAVGAYGSGVIFCVWLQTTDCRLGLRPLRCLSRSIQRL